MNVVALILALVAVVVFLAAHYAVPRKWATVPLGLVALTLALVVQFVWQAHVWTVN